jgi:hypothetical protein
MKLPSFYDAVAGMVTLLLLVAVIVYPIFGIETPQLIGSAFAVALGWTFRANVAATNGINKLRGGTPNGATSPTSATGPDSA